MLTNVDRRLKQIFRSTDNFGGIPVIACGDLNQLKLVIDKWIFAGESSNYAVLAGSVLWNEFKYFDLTEITQQRDDQPFAIALNNMSQGTMTPEDVALFRSRFVEPRSMPQTPVCPFYTNHWHFDSRLSFFRRG